MANTIDKKRAEGCNCFSFLFSFLPKSNIRTCRKMNKQFWHRNASTVLTCLGGVGLVVTTVLSAKATPKALQLLKEAKEEKGEELSKWEKVRVAGPKYIPTIITGTATLACIFGANVLNKHQQASLISAYALLDESYKKYRRKVVELYGEETHNEIVKAITIEEANEVYMHASNLGVDCTKFLEEDFSEPILFYDEYGKRYFEAPIEQVLLAEYYFNRNYTMRGFALLNEFYEFLGLEQTDYGSEVGWVICDEGIYWVDFNHRKVELDDGLECYIIEMLFEPTMKWKEYY